MIRSGNPGFVKEVKYNRLIVLSLSSDFALPAAVFEKLFGNFQKTSNVKNMRNVISVKTESIPVILIKI